MNPPVTTLSEPPSEGGRDLRTYGKIFWRWKWLFLVCVLALPTAAYFLSARNAKVYESKVVMQISPLSVDSPLVGAQAAPDTAQTVNNAARLIETSGVAAAAGRRLHPPPRNSRSLLDQIVVIPDPEASFVTISARSSTPSAPPTSPTRSPRP